MNTATLLSPHVKTELHASQLVLSPLNVRQTPRSADYLEELAASIKANGLMHAITVHPMPKKKGKPLYGVCAGGGRFAAIQLLLSRGELDDERDLIECNLIGEAEAVRMSLAENVHREPLHPADEFDGFKRMIEAGESIEDTAAAFRVSPQVVQRRLRLANVEPSFIALFRQDEITLDQLMALATTTDHEVQRRVWEDLPDYSRHASRIRAAIVGEKLDISRSPLVRFVGLDAYTQAGGAVEQDLFAQQDNSGFIVDVPLLESLARARLEDVAAQVQGEGWAWVSVALSQADAQLSDYSRAPSFQREATDEEKTRLANIEREIDAFYDKDDCGDDITDAERENVEALEHERECIIDSWVSYTDAVKASAGVVVTVSHDGTDIEIVAGLVRPEDRKAARDAATTNAIQGTKETERKKDAPSETMTRRLTAHRTRALQAVLAQRSDVALALLVYRLALPVFYKGSYGAQCLGIRIERPSLERDADDIPQCAASAALAEQHKQIKQQLPKKTRDLLLWLLSQPQQQLVALLAFCVAEGLDTVQSSVTRNDDIEALMQAIDFDMADWWQPTAAGFFTYLKKDDTLAVLKEAVSSKAAQSCAALKKPDLVAAAETAVRDTRWLPPMLRRKAARKGK